MIPRSVQAPTIPIPFHRLLKVVAIVDTANAQTKELLDLIASENFEVEITDSFDRDVDEDASVGAYIACVDGVRRDGARGLAGRVRSLGFDTPLWRLPIRTPYPTSRSSVGSVRSTATSISASRRPRSTRSR